MASPIPPLTAADKKWIEQAYTAGQRLQASRQFDEALRAYRKLLARYPFVAEAHFQIARLHLADARFVEARAACEAALKLRPREESLWWLLADIARDEGKLAPGAIVARARKAGMDDDALGRIRRRFDQKSGNMVLRTAPAEARPYLERAEQAANAGDHAAALRHLNRALRKAPQSPEILARRAHVLLTLGDLDAALDDATAAVRMEPGIGPNWAIWARIRKIKPDDPLLPELERQHGKAEPGSDNRRQMAYALAKAMEDIRADDRLFTYLNEGNDLTAKRYPYGAESDEASAKLVREVYTPALVKRWSGGGDKSLTPIFVTGLPRSGTTLTEQIIASHPQVVAGGEAGILHPPMEKLLQRIAAEGVEAGAGYAEVGRKYAAEMADLFPGRKIVTDKSISSYVHIGHIPLALPKAKIVVLRRDPRDSCLAMLKQRFADGVHRHTNSMEWTAGFYKLFARQVAFWRETAPEAFIEVHYEDIVADLETQARRLIDYCGLPWDDACLDFHKNERAVTTLSSAQVRQPIYSSSVGAWKRYEKDLAPLLKALGPIEDLP